MSTVMGRFPRLRICSRAIFLLAVHLPLKPPYYPPSLFGLLRPCLVKHTFYIYIYAFSRRFYPKRLTIAFRLYIFISMCVPWESNSQTFVLLTQCSTTEPHRNTYTVAGQAGGFLHTMAVLQAYQADPLKEIEEREDIKNDLSLRATKETARAIGAVYGSPCGHARKGILIWYCLRLTIKTGSFC